jgi:hypothetical protein
MRSLKPSKKRISSSSKHEISLLFWWVIFDLKDTDGHCTTLSVTEYTSSTVTRTAPQPSNFNELIHAQGLLLIILVRTLFLGGAFSLIGQTDIHSIIVKNYISNRGLNPERCKIFALFCVFCYVNKAAKFDK